MKLVKKAKIEVVTIGNLREGDEILWSNIRCKVLEIDRFKRKVTFVPSSLPLSYHSNPLEGSYLHYYRILECEEISTCTICGKRIESGDFCEECITEHEMPFLLDSQLRREGDDMSHYIYLCPKCAKEKHKLKPVHFPHGFGIKEVFIDGKKAELVFLSPSQKRKCADCGRWIRHTWQIKRQRND